MSTGRLNGSSLLNGPLVQEPVLGFVQGVSRNFLLDHVLDFGLDLVERGRLEFLKSHEEDWQPLDTAPARSQGVDQHRPESMTPALLKLNEKLFGRI